MNVTVFTVEELKNLMKETATFAVDAYIQRNPPQESTIPINFLTKKQAAELIQVNINTIGNWMQSGKLKFSKVERGVRILQSDLFTTLKSRSSQL